VHSSIDAFAPEESGLNVDELSQPWLLVTLCKIASSTADEHSVCDVCLASCIDQLHGDVDFLFMSGRNRANGVAFGLFEKFDHLAFTSWRVRNDFGSESDKLFGFGGRRVKSKTSDRVDLATEVGVGKKQLSDEESCLAVGRGDEYVA
jgi:hypothetical protein